MERYLARRAGAGLSAVARLPAAEVRPAKPDTPGPGCGARRCCCWAWAPLAGTQTGRRRKDASRKRSGRQTRRPAPGRNAEAVAGLLNQCEAALRAEQPDADRAAVALDAADRCAADGGAEALAGRLARCRADLALLRESDTIDNLIWTWLYDETGGSGCANEIIVARWRSVLADYGAVPRQTPAAETGKRVGDSLVRERLLAALDMWLVLEPSAPERRTGDPDRAWVRAVLRAADRDPYRDAVRDTGRSPASKVTTGPGLPPCLGGRKNCAAGPVCGRPRPVDCGLAAAATGRVEKCLPRPAEGSGSAHYAG